MEGLLFKIRALRQAKNITQAAIAKQLCIKQSAYSQIESGKISLTMERFEKIASVLSIPADELLHKTTDELLARLTPDGPVEA